LTPRRRSPPPWPPAAAIGRPWWARCCPRGCRPRPGRSNDARLSPAAPSPATGPPASLNCPTSQAGGKSVLRVTPGGRSAAISAGSKSSANSGPDGHGIWRPTKCVVSRTCVDLRRAIGCDESRQRGSLTPDHGIGVRIPASQPIAQRVPGPSAIVSAECLPVAHLDVLGEAV